MKIPLRYQVSEYDCGPTSLLNALNYLFQREEISPELIRNIMLYSLDCYGSGGAPGKRGTSRMAMMFLSNWLDGVGKTGILPVESRYLSGRDVRMDAHSSLVDALHRNGVAVVRLYLDGEITMCCSPGKRRDAFICSILITCPTGLRKLK